jgi:repressor of nif and glnA expression
MCCRSRSIDLLLLELGVDWKAVCGGTFVQYGDIYCLIFRDILRYSASIVVMSSGYLSRCILCEDWIILIGVLVVYFAYFRRL